MKRHGIEVNTILQDNPVLFESMNALFTSPPSLDPADPSVQDCPAVRYVLSGNLRVPFVDGRGPVPIKGKVRLAKDCTGALYVADCEGTTGRFDREFGKGVSITGGWISLAPNDGRIVSTLHGAFRYSDGSNVEAGGTLDADIFFGADERDRINIGTLVTDAWLKLGRGQPLTGATIRFEMCTQPPNPRFPARCVIDEMDEYLFQSDEPVQLGRLCLSGILDNPVTMAVSIDLSNRSIRPRVTVYPAMLRLSGFGKNCIVFISGEAVDKPFRIDGSGEWAASISSSPWLHLVCPDDPAGPSLVEGMAFFIGTLKGTGFYSYELSATSELTNAVAFPQSRWPQTLPEQRITLSISRDGTVDLRIVFDQLVIDGYSICSPEGTDGKIFATLGMSGLAFTGGGVLRSVHSTHLSRMLPPFIIDGKNSVHLPDGRIVEIAEWLSE